MGSIPKGKYNIELVKRTRELIETYNGIYKHTLLMNAILCLIVLPEQVNSIRKKKLKFMNLNLNEIAEIQFVLNSQNFFFDKGKSHYDLKNLLRRIRNGIAHQRIESISENDVWKGVIIQDFDRKDNLGLNMELKTAELRTLALFIADEYLKEITNTNQ